MLQIPNSISRMRKGYPMTCEEIFARRTRPTFPCSTLGIESIWWRNALKIVMSRAAILSSLQSQTTVFLRTRIRKKKIVYPRFRRVISVRAVILQPVVQRVRWFLKPFGYTPSTEVFHLRPINSQELPRVLDQLFQNPLLLALPPRGIHNIC